MWLKYLPGSAAMRARSTARSSSRGPNFVAPVGQAAAHAVARPCETRSAHMSHFLTRGSVLLHSYLGTLNGQASMQYRQPMHLFSSYTTGPAAVFWKAPTGQAETQLGTLQCMHISRAKRGPRRLTTENVLSERVSDRTSSDV